MRYKFTGQVTANQMTDLIEALKDSTEDLPLCYTLRVEGANPHIILDIMSGDYDRGIIDEARNKRALAPCSGSV